MLKMVTTSPVKLIGVSGSLKIKLAVVIVTTSLKMPQMLSVTTLVRFRRANSDEVMRKARQPGKIRIPTPRRWPFISNNLDRPAERAENPSTGTASTKRLRNMTGARKKMEEKGFAVAGLRSSRIWVKDQRKPDEHAEDMTRMKPKAWKAASPATIITTPTVMMRMIITSRQDGCSRRKRNANMSTKPSADDLHIAKGRISNY